MKDFLRHWLVTSIALAVTAWLLAGVEVRSLAALAVAAIVMGFLNAVVKPVVVLLTLPLTVLTLGLFYLILNGMFFALAAWLVPGFSVASIGWGIGGAIVMWLVSTFVGSLVRPSPDEEYGPHFHDRY
ncbi:MAG TPA: phage holin family protein [Candidatus Krumholzibacteria bacterium]|nr:phage holin family protein [Candidatus Krumholzibacteria bacterium]